MGEFLCSFNEGSKKMRNLLGGKGANLSEMTGMGLPVPFGFVITTKACGRFFAGGGALDAQIVEEMRTKIREVEEVTGKEFAAGKPAACFSAHKQRDKDTYHDRYGV